MSDPFASAVRLNRDLSAFRDSAGGGRLGTVTRIGPHLTLRIDPEAKARGRWTSPAGTLVDLDIAVDHPGGWCSLHLGLDPAGPGPAGPGAADLGPAEEIGLACRTRAGGFDLVRPVLRSGTAQGALGSVAGGVAGLGGRAAQLAGQSGFTDWAFPRHLLSRPEESLHMDLIRLAQSDIPRRAPWRELVLFLPTHRLRWRLIDLKLVLL
jgi:hypothetical protein